jgi:hypothetical protein
MITINARNANQAFPKVLYNVRRYGYEEESRNGLVMRFPYPVGITYERPWEMMLFNERRDANPFFHIMEALWMLAGRNDVWFPALFNSNIANYSDDGNIFHGAYGYRWRHHFGHDQIKMVVSALTDNPRDRRIVMQMWDPIHDLGQDGKDFPCNLCITFSVIEDEILDMTVFNRSNDIVWGALGANVVHFAFLHQFIAACVPGVKQGSYYQISTNMHLYLEPHSGLMHSEASLTIPKNQLIYEGNPDFRQGFRARNMFGNDPWRTLRGIEKFVNDPTERSVGPEGWPRLVREAAMPLFDAWMAFKQYGDGIDRYDRALEHLRRVTINDWRIACEEWIIRRKRKALDKENLI